MREDAQERLESSYMKLTEVMFCGKNIHVENKGMEKIIATIIPRKQKKLYMIFISGIILYKMYLFQDKP